MRSQITDKFKIVPFLFLLLAVCSFQCFIPGKCKKKNHLATVADSIYNRNPSNSYFDTLQFGVWWWCLEKKQNKLNKSSDLTNDANKTEWMYD